MNFEEYQKLAYRTCNPNLSYEKRIVNAALGLAGEAGEAADHVKKWFCQEHDLNRGEIINEIGDVLWYLALFATSMDISLEYIAQANIDKLRARYPDGFSAERSKNREE